MKTTKILKLITFVFFIGIIATSCVDSDDYSIPNIQDAPGDTFDLTNDIALSQIKQMYSGSLVDFSEAGNGGRMTTSGYVVSNDEAGNFYKTLIIQDAPENPTAALQINIDATSLYAQYKPGQKVYITLYDADLEDASGIPLPSLGMTDYHGVLQIGTIDGTSTGRIGLFDYPYYLTRSSEVATLVPTIITPSQFDDSYINMLIQIDDMQLTGAEVGQGYANYTNTYTANRHLKNCVDDSETILRNSGYSDFKNTPFPEGRGSIVCVFSKYNSDYQLFVRDTDDVIFEDGRCDPLFEEFFETNFTTWTNFSVSGDQVWSNNTYGNPGNCAAMSGYNSGTTYANEDWLISPAIDLSGVTTAILNFQTAKNYTGNTLEVFMSTDYTSGEDPNTSGTWTPLTVTLSTGGWDWTDSGDIDVSSAVGGDLFIAYKYTCDSSSSATYEIDNVKVFVP